MLQPTWGAGEPGHPPRAAGQAVEDPVPAPSWNPVMALRGARDDGRTPIDAQSAPLPGTRKLRMEPGAIPAMSVTGMCR